MTSRAKALRMALDLYRLYRQSLLKSNDEGWLVYSYYAEKRVYDFHHPEEIRALAIRVAKGALQ